MSMKQFVEKEIDGQLRLAKHVIAATDKPQNLVFSPLPIHLVLAVSAAGSSGSTRAQLLTYLNSDRVEQLNSFFPQIANAVFADGSPLGGPLLSIKNGLWVDRSLNLKPAFQDVVKNSYKAVAETADFRNKAEEARKEVNAWAEEGTKGLIKDILPPNSVNELTRLIFANTVYFNGNWESQFHPRFTRDRDFHLLDGTTIKAPFMTNSCKKFFRALDGFKVARLPYKQGNDERRFSMYIYLPDARDGLPSLVERMCSEAGFIDRHLPREAQRLGKFLIPKFKIGFEFEAIEIVKKLGVVDLFEMGGLTEMVEERGEGEALFVDRFSQKAFVEVNEVGTEAAAATAGMVGGGYPPPLEFVADHPFLFTIREDTTGVLLFIGQLLDPLAHA